MKHRITDLPAWGTTDCPKCGEKAASTAWCRAEPCTYIGPTRSIYTAGDMANEAIEHMHRRCGCCGFDRLEAPKDAKVQT